MKIIRVGFTGTRSGMSIPQMRSFHAFLRKLRDRNHHLTEGKARICFHHGDCVGSDAEAHTICLLTCTEVVIHPPSDERFRAFCKHYTRMLPAKEYLDRNKDIVLDSEFLIATPNSEREEVRSGTWSTVRFARREQKPIRLIFPNGDIEEEV